MRRWMWAWAALPGCDRPEEAICEGIGVEELLSGQEDLGRSIHRRLDAAGTVREEEQWADAYPYPWPYSSSEYDAEGREIVRTWDPSASGEPQTERWSYDEIGRLTRRDRSGSDGLSIESYRYQYDGPLLISRTLSREGSPAVVYDLYSYDFDDRPILHEIDYDGDGVLSTFVAWTYDAPAPSLDGTIETSWSRVLSGVPDRFEEVRYDGEQRMVFREGIGVTDGSEVPDSARTETWTYDDRGRVASLRVDTTGSEQETAYTYTPSGRIALVETVARALQAESTLRSSQGTTYDPEERVLTQTHTVSLDDGTEAASVWLWEWSCDGALTSR